MVLTVRNSSWSLEIEQAILTNNFSTLLRGSDCIKNPSENAIMKH